MMGAAAGLGVGLALVGLAFMLDATVRSEAELMASIDLPVLALLPFVTTEHDLRQRSRRRLVEWTAAAALLITAVGLTWFLRLWRFVL